ncbi:gibberellin 2-beta-dioxygenase 1-like protein [Cinnamomum micranthum f. kanehirae]|uniref:gibberellin 2beta-dioxygenase n=1 Tax=Cinnamomum micranthum f. kanehirae TaxID=337451 RepID=A0A3S4PXQ9_9MAGN|nr:gibberellin 2-beta-dioxygenase 1-like protein [Cinnamomum micranthum f. kanehirae]
MVLLVDQISLIRNQKPSLFSDIPSIDLSKPNSKSLLVKACEEVGFLKVTNHGIPLEVMDRLESEAMKFFSLPRLEKEQAEAARPNRFGYGNKIIGGNGDVGWVEYLLLQANQKSISQISYQLFKEKPEVFCSAASDYISSVKKLACDVLELLADGLNIQQRTIFSKHFMGEENDSLFRINHYPPCPELQAVDCNLIGFGEHTDPQIISVLRSNNTSGLQISLKDGTWVSVPSDQTSFFIIVGDALQVMTNGRFRSVKHRVLTSSAKSRVSMIYFGAPALRERIAPLPLLMAEGEKSLYKGFTWSEYIESAFKTRLADNRLGVLEKNV